jgi:hypothetical protein
MFPNQTLKDASRPATVLKYTASRAKYNYDLSVYPVNAFRESPPSCSSPSPPPSFFLPYLVHSRTSLFLQRIYMPRRRHPGPSNNKARGAAKIDLIKPEPNKYGNDQVASQSAQFTLFGHSCMGAQRRITGTYVMLNPYKWVFLLPPFRSLVSSFLFSSCIFGICFPCACLCLCLGGC